MKTTNELYRVHSAMWKHLNYEEALKLRIVFAQRAMDYYRGVYNEAGYQASEKAVAFNRTLLAELNEK